MNCQGDSSKECPEIRINLLNSFFLVGELFFDKLIIFEVIFGGTTLVSKYIQPGKKSAHMRTWTKIKSVSVI